MLRRHVIVLPHVTSECLMDYPPLDLLLLCRERRNDDLLKELKRGIQLQRRLRLCDQKHGWTVLHEACERNNAEALHWLLLFGGDPNVQGHGGQTPLHVACARARSQCVKLLLRHGADVKAIDNKKQTPKNKIKLTFLTKSEKKEEAGVVQRLLTSHGTHPKAQTHVQQDKDRQTD